MKFTFGTLKSFIKRTQNSRTMVQDWLLRQRRNETEYWPIYFCKKYCGKIHVGLASFIVLQRHWCLNKLWSTNICFWLVDVPIWWLRIGTRDFRVYKVRVQPGICFANNTWAKLPLRFEKISRTLTNEWQEIWWKFENTWNIRGKFYKAVFSHTCYHYEFTMWWIVNLHSLAVSRIFDWF